MDFGDLYREFKEEQNALPKRLNERVLIIDGLNTFIRVFSCSPATNEDGLHIGGISGTLTSIAKSIRELKPSRCVVVFDGKGGSIRRRKIFPEYKNKNFVRERLNRLYDFKESPEKETEAMFRQIVRLTEYIDFLPISTIAIDNIEADDTISILRNYILEQNPDNKVIILSTDKDFLQLVNERVSVYSPVKKKLYDSAMVVKDFGVIPQNMVVLRSVEGDQSDSIPGVKGVGKKTLKKYYPALFINEEYSIEEMVQRAKENMECAKAYKTIYENVDVLERNERLMRLDEVEVSGTTKLNIIEKFNQPVPTLNKNEFKRIATDDKMWNVLPDIDKWLMSSFHTLNAFAMETQENK